MDRLTTEKSPGRASHHPAVLRPGMPVLLAVDGYPRRVRATVGKHRLGQVAGIGTDARGVYPDDAGHLSLAPRTAGDQRPDGKTRAAVSRASPVRQGHAARRCRLPALAVAASLAGGAQRATTAITGDPRPGRFQPGQGSPVIAV